MTEQLRKRPRVLVEQLTVGSGEATQVLNPVVRWRVRREATEDAVQESVDELVLCGEIAVERHRRCLQACGDRAQGEGVEALLRHLLGRVQDQVARERTAWTAPAGRRGA